MPKVYNFVERLGFSRGVREQMDMDILRMMINGCTKVTKADKEQDMKGIDYIATLRRGAQIYIDAKSRDRGCSEFWENEEPEIALEKWSVIGKKVGWTLDETKLTHYVLFTFDPMDSEACYLLDFQTLRMAFRQNCRKWYKKYKVDEQDSGAWKSECVFVPVKVVCKAMDELRVSRLSMVRKIPS